MEKRQPQKRRARPQAAVRPGRPRVELIDGEPYMLVELRDGDRRIVLKLRSCFGAAQ